MYRNETEPHLTFPDVNIIFLKSPIDYKISYYRPPEGGRLYDMKDVSGYAFLRTYYV